MGGLLHLVQLGGGLAEPQPDQAPPRCTKCNTPSIGQCSVPITVLLCPMLCDFSVPVKELILTRTDIFISEMLALPVTTHSRYAISFTDSKEIDVTSLKNQTHKNYLSKPVCQLNIYTSLFRQQKAVQQ